MDADDIQLVDILADLAEENDIASNVDDDSVLGSQYSTLNEPIKNDPEEEEIEDLNITSLDLDLSSWESMYNQKSNQHDNTVKDNKQNTESADDSNVTEENCEDVTLVNISQVDGVDDFYEILKYEKETTNSLSNKDNTAVQCLFKATENSKHNSCVSIINAKKDCTTYILHRNVMDIVKYIVNNPSKRYLRKELYNFVNRYYFYIFLKTSKNLQSTIIKHSHNDTSDVVRNACYLKNNESRIICNKKPEEELYNARCQLQLDHRDLDVYDIDEMESFESLERNYITNYEEDNCEKDSKFYVQKGVFLNSNISNHELSMKFTISSVDGATATDSSDTESEADVTIDRQEERVCVYKSNKKNVLQSIVQITPKKRKRDFKEDDHESPSKRRNVAPKTPKRRYDSPGKAPRSPQLSGNYSPLNIIITSPKSRSPIRQSERSPKRSQYTRTPDVSSTTPKHKIRPLRVSLLREKFLTSDLGNSSSFIIFMRIF